jgi:hypothetical protein
MTAVFLGIDPASSLAAVASIDEHAGLRYAELRASGEPLRRLDSIGRQLREFLNAAADVGVHACVIERPVTRHGGMTLGGAFGVCGVEAVRALACPVVDWTPAQIDARVYRAGKPAGGDRKARSMAHARSLGYEGGSQDIADALVAADCARLLCMDNDAKEAA